MKVALLTFPGLYNSFYNEAATLYAQRLEPSVLYIAPKDPSIESIFVSDNRPRPDVDLYLCSVYTRGWNEFVAFSQMVGRDRIIAGGYHPTAEPQETLSFAHKVVTGYCGNIDEIISAPSQGIFNGAFAFTPLHRNLIDMKSLRQVYPDIYPNDISGSMVSSVGCPYSCEFCSTPNMSGTRMRVANLEYVDREIENLKNHGASTVFLRDESFATNPELKEISARFKDQFKMVYSFGTGSIFAQREDYIRHLVEMGWHSLNFGLEDIGVRYRKNKNLKLATDNCKKHGLRFVMSFIVNDDGKSKDEAKANYNALYEAFLDHLPSQVCANFIMPFPGTALWSKYKNRIGRDDFDKFDSKTPVFASSELRDWHKRMLVAIQLRYYLSPEYNKKVRKFDCGDTLYLRLKELEREYELVGRDLENFLEL